VTEGGPKTSFVNQAGSRPPPLDCVWGALNNVEGRQPPAECRVRA